MITGILSAVGSALAGGGTGLIGAVAQKVVDLKVKKLEIERDVKMRALDIKELGMEIDRDVQVSNIEADMARDVADADIQKASYESDKASYGIKFVDAVRGLMRPAMTLYAMGLLTWLSVKVYQFVDGLAAMPPAEVYATWLIIIDSIIYLATAAFTWWFGTRPDRSNKANGSR